VTDVETDCLVIGAGPAGASAALWLDSFGISFLLLERGQQIGGELQRINLPIQNVLGLGAVSGAAFLGAVERDLERLRAEVRLGVAVEAIDPMSKEVLTSAGAFRARSLILASGLRRRPLDLPGVEDLLNRGVTYSGTLDRARIAGHPVAVVGGGDGALENALLLAEASPQVYLVHRESALNGRGAFAEKVAVHPRIEVLLETQVARVVGDGGGLSAVELETPAGPRRLEVPWLVVKIGFVPNTDALRPGTLRLDEAGYVEVDRYLRTSAPGAFAAGDVCNPRSPCIAGAVGDGAVAAREVHTYLEGERDR